jgi:NTP pyrophosphatase (non-canonical NTP hydrolase)
MSAPAAERHTLWRVDFAEYQHASRQTAKYPRQAWLAYPALGLAGEAGEVAEHAKKAIRDDAGQISDARRTAMARELGDVLWYASQLASELGLELEQIARENLDKLLSRQRRGVLSGSGDDR